MLTVIRMGSKGLAIQVSSDRIVFPRTKIAGTVL